MENQDNCNQMLGLQESIMLADGQKYMFNELNLEDLSQIAKAKKENGNMIDEVAEQIFYMVRKGHPSLTRERLKTLVTVSMLNPKSRNSIIPIINRLAGGFSEDQAKNE